MATIPMGNLFSLVKYLSEHWRNKSIFMYINVELHKQTLEGYSKFRLSKKTSAQTRNFFFDIDQSVLSTVSTLFITKNVISIEFKFVLKPIDMREDCY